MSQQQDPSAVLTLLCDDCYTKSQDQQQFKNHILESKEHQQPSLNRGNSSNSSSSSRSITVPTVITNKCGLITAPQPPQPLDTNNDFIQDDDGYCEIDEIRLPAIIKMTSGNSSTAVTSPTSTTIPIANAELKRQMITNTDSIPEETEHEINSEKSSDAADQIEKLHVEESTKIYGDPINDNDFPLTDDKSNAITVGTNNNKCTDEITNEIGTSDSITQPTSEVNFCMSDTCGAVNRSVIAHPRAIAPAIPCHLISTYVSALNLQISQLLVSY